MKKWVLFFSIIVNSCSATQNNEFLYNLPAMYLQIESDQFSQLLADHNKSQISAAIQFESKKHNILLRYSGKSTLNDPKKSYHLYFKENFKSHREYRLSAQNSDQSYLRSMFGFWVFKQAGLNTPHIEPVSLIVNGVYQGIYFLIELINQDFFENQKLPLTSLYKSRFGRLNHSDLRIDSINDLYIGFAAKENPNYMHHKAMYY